MRPYLVAAATTAALLCPLAVAPASASGDVTLVCGAIGRTSTSCAATGVVGTTVVRGLVTLDYSEGGDCLSSIASGSASGAVNFSFSWSRFGPTGLITTFGDITGQGVVVFGTACLSAPVVIHIVGV